MAKTKLIFAYDYSVFTNELTMLLKMVAPYIDVVKVGLQAMTAYDSRGMNVAYKVQRYVWTQHHKPVMWDGKFLDIGNTMGQAATNISVFSSVQMATVHAQASNTGLQAVVKAWEGKVMPLAVTALTDLDDKDCWDRFARDSAQTVADHAKLAYACGVRGFVCSANEVRILRDLFGNDVAIVTPAIRPLFAVAKDEQQRVATPTMAAQAGADFIVVGRPIAHPPEGKTPEQAAREIREELAAA